MKLNISISLDADESASLADHAESTLATVEDSDGNKHQLCAARGAIVVTFGDVPVVITPHGYEKPAPKTEPESVVKKVKGRFGR